MVSLQAPGIERTGAGGMCGDDDKEDEDVLDSMVDGCCDEGEVKIIVPIFVMLENEVINK